MQVLDASPDYMLDLIVELEAREAELEENGLLISEVFCGKSLIILKEST